MSDPKDYEEQELLQRIAEGDNRALQILHEKHFMLHDIVEQDQILLHKAFKENHYAFWPI